MQSVMHKLGSLTPCPALAYQSVPWIVAVTHWTSTISTRWHARCALSTLTEWTVTLHEGMLHGRACTIPVQAADNTIQSICDIQTVHPVSTFAHARDNVSA